MNKLQKAFKASLPVMAGYIVLGIGFGILLQSAGYKWYWATIISLAVYAGSMQYVMVDLLAGAAGIISTAIMTLFVNLRHLFYGIAFIDRYKNTGKYKPLLIFTLTDETFSVLCSDEDDDVKYELYLSLMNYSYWVLGSTIGALLGSLVAFNSAGIEFSMTTIFVITFVEQWLKTKNHLPALTGLVLSIITLIVFGPANFLIPDMALITLVLFIERKWLGDEYE